MDLTSIMSTLMSADSLNNISEKTGSSKKEVKSVLTSALPLLLAGAKDQADDESTAEGFAAALQQHSKNDTKDLSSFLGKVDLADGAKIIGHLLGGKTESTTQTLAQSSGASSNNTANILAAAAPLLMSLLGQQSQKEEEENATGQLVGTLVSSMLSNVDVGDLLMGMLGADSDKEEEKEETAAKPKKKKPSSSGKTSTAKKKPASGKTSTAKKKPASSTSAAKKKPARTAKKKTEDSKKTSAKKKEASAASKLGDAAGILMKLLK